MKYREQRRKEGNSGRKEDGEKTVSSPSDPILTSSLWFPTHFPLHRLLYVNAGTGLLALEDSPVAARKRGMKTMTVSFKGAEQRSLFCHIQT